jgi:glyoxylase-like metal-dependent hydrolase (beta-lactamase superfamily II)
MLRTAIAACAVFAAACAGAKKTPEAPKAGGALYTFTSDAGGFDTHSFWYDTGSEVVVFDAQFTPQLAERLLGEIRGKTKSPVRYLVISHPNPDKFNGAEVFRKAGAKVVASEATAAAIPGVHEYKKYFFVKIAKMFAEADYPQAPAIDLTFRGEYRLALTGGEVELRELKNAGVSSTQTVAYIPALKALIVGDLVHHRAHAWLEGGVVGGQPKPDLSAWKAALGELRAFGGATVYGGRGEPAPVEEAVRDEIEYLTRAEAIVSEYIAALGSKKGELGGEKAGEHYKKLAAKMGEAFPGYALPYMIEYGVYGLANSIAAR